MTTFTIPPKTHPRERWTTEIETTKEGWRTCHVIVRGPDGVTWEYDRNYSFLKTFEPFRQLAADGTWREYALISRSYTRTDVLDLATGEIIATEDRDEGGHGFCPVEFYVPDWWEPDVWGEQDDSVKPGDPDWKEIMGASRGNLGFLAGCVWGDDGSWKLQQLDLSRLSEGRITRSAPYGYVELGSAKLRDAVSVNWEYRRVTIEVPAVFSMDTGALFPWSLDGLNREQAKPVDVTPTNVTPAREATTDAEADNIAASVESAVGE